MRELLAHGDVCERRDAGSLTASEFYERFVDTSTPVVLTGVVDGWSPMLREAFTRGQAAETSLLSDSFFRPDLLCGGLGFVAPMAIC